MLSVGVQKSGVHVFQEPVKLPGEKKLNCKIQLEVLFVAKKPTNLNN